MPFSIIIDLTKHKHLCVNQKHLCIDYESKSNVGLPIDNDSEKAFQWIHESITLYRYFKYRF